MIRIKLTKSQWKKLSDISEHSGLLVVGSVIIPFILNKADIFGIIKGIVVAMFLWYISVAAAGKYND